MSYYITHNGKKIDIEKGIHSDDICLEDIAHHLTKICRFAGTLDLDTHYSVAMHSINLYRYALFVEDNLSLAQYLLLHDASEAYLGDIVSGLKCHLPDYKAIERSVTDTIFNKYLPDISWKTRTSLDGIALMLDKRILLNEAKALFPDFYEHFEKQDKYALGPLEGKGWELTLDWKLSATRDIYLGLCKSLGMKD